MTDYAIYCQRLRDVGITPLPFADWLLARAHDENDFSALQDLIDWAENELEARA